MFKKPIYFNFSLRHTKLLVYMNSNFKGRFSCPCETSLSFFLPITHTQPRSQFNSAYTAFTIFEHEGHQKIPTGCLPSSHLFSCGHHNAKTPSTWRHSRIQRSQMSITSYGSKEHQHKTNKLVLLIFFLLYIARICIDSISRLYNFSPRFLLVVVTLQQCEALATMFFVSVLDGVLMVEMGRVTWDPVESQRKKCRTERGHQKVTVVVVVFVVIKTQKVKETIWWVFGGRQAHTVTPIERVDGF